MGCVMIQNFLCNELICDELEECVNLPVKVEDDAGYSYSPVIRIRPLRATVLSFKLASIQYDLFKLFSTYITIEDYVNMLHT